ncbi:MAG: TIGR03808 family TAT-translocated repetitive protein [Pseudomonadota bacterium]
MDQLDRRTLLTHSLTGAAGLSLVATTATHAATSTQDRSPTSKIIVKLSGEGDETATIQAALDLVSRNGGGIVELPSGTFPITTLSVPARTTLRGSGNSTTLRIMGGQSAVSCQRVHDVTIEALQIDARFSAETGIEATDSKRLTLRGLTVSETADTAIKLERCSGTIHECRMSNLANAGIFALDSDNLQITDNTITDCGNNGIQVWRSKPGSDASTITGNRINTITARAGGTGQNGNGINLFRANDVQVLANHISDCTYSAIRANASSNTQITSNTCLRSGEVAIYAEFGFEGALIASNIVDLAATGIAVTNFSDGGRLAVVQGNLIRNLFRREHEQVDKRGVGISIEADAAVSGNTIETAATAGIAVGHHQHMRDCAVTGNVVRKSSHGILVSSNADAGACLVANNLVSGANLGAINGHDGRTSIGPDLAHGSTTTDRIAITGNLAVM